MFVTSIASLWFPLSQVSLLYLSFKNMVVRFVWYCLFLLNIIFKFLYIYPSSTYSNKNSTIYFWIAIVTSEFTILILKNMVLRLMWYRLVFNSTHFKVYILFLCINTQWRTMASFFCVIAIVTGEFTILILWKYRFKVCVISFGFYSFHFKVYIHLICINTQQRTRAPFDKTSGISSRNHQKTGLYEG